MSIEHDSLPANPRLETLLRQIVAAHDLQLAQNQRVRARLGLHPHQTASLSTATLPSSRQGPIPIPSAEQDVSPMIATTSGRLRQQWLQFALAAIGFIAVGVLLALLFGSGSDDPSSQPGTAASPEAIATATTPATAMADTPVSSALPTPDETGTYSGITFEQAQAIVPFEIVMPGAVPDGLEPPGITVVESPPLAVGGRVYRVEMWFELSGDESPRKSVQFTQIASPGSGNALGTWRAWRVVQGARE